MSVPHPGGDPNAHLYEQLKRDVLERIPHIRTIEYVPDVIEATHLRATFDPDRLDPPTGPEPPELQITWYRGTPRDWFRVNYHDPNTNVHAGWHQDEEHPGSATHTSSTRRTTNGIDGVSRSPTRHRRLSYGKSWRNSSMSYFRPTSEPSRHASGPFNP